MLVHGASIGQRLRGRQSGRRLRRRPCSQRWNKDFGCRRLVMERHVRPHCIILAAPALDHDLRLAERIEDFPVEQLVSQPGIRALDVAVFPWPSRRDVCRPHANRCGPCLTASAMNSGPLSERMCPGMPPARNSSHRTSMTSVELSLRRTLIAKLRA